MHLDNPHPIPPHEREFHHEPTHVNMMEKLEHIEEILRRIEERM